MVKFIVQVRAIRHLTADLTIQARNEEEARETAKSHLDQVNWDESEPEDQQIESVSRVESDHV